MRWTERQVATAVEMHTAGVMPADIAKAVGRTPRAVTEKIMVLRAISDVPAMRGRGRPSSPFTDSRERERDRLRKQRFRAGMVERSLRMTPEAAAKLDRARERGGFRNASELVAALIAREPEPESSQGCV